MKKFLSFHSFTQCNFSKKFWIRFGVLILVINTLPSSLVTNKKKWRVQKHSLSRDETNLWSSFYESQDGEERKEEKKRERSDSTIMKSMDTWSWMCWSHEYHTWTSCIGCNNSTQFRSSLFHSFLELLRRVRWETYNTKNIACFQAIFWQLRLSKQPFIPNLFPLLSVFRITFHELSCHAFHHSISWTALHFSVSYVCSSLLVSHKLCVTVWI